MRIPATQADYQHAVSARRGFALPGYPKLAQAGFDGDYVSSIHMTSGNLHGPMLISKDWLDARSARRHRAELLQHDYLAQIIYNKVIDLTLALVRLTRADIYISPIFHLLKPKRSSVIPADHARASFEAAGQFELLARKPLALGRDSAAVLRHFGVPHIEVPHPVTRKHSLETRAPVIVEALNRL